MLAIHHFLSASATLLLVSCALARSLNDQAVSKELADLVTAGGNNNNNNNEPYDDSQTLADLWDFLLSTGHVAPEGMVSVKRSWPNGYLVPSSMKRKMFWTPLGHLPASARLGRPQNMRPSMEDSGSPVFRYG